MPRYGSPNISNVPYGNAYLINTPEIDAARDRMFQQAQQQSLLAMHTSNQLDQDMAREFAKVRSIDSPLIINKYNQYKDIQKQVLFNPRVQRDANLYHQLKGQADQALADTYQAINKSSELQQTQKDLMTMYRTHPQRMMDDYGDRFRELQSTPYDRLDKSKYGDLGNPDTFLYKDTTDFNKMDTAALKASQFDNPIDTPDPNNKWAINRVTLKSFNPRSYRDSLLLQGSRDPNYVHSAAHLSANLPVPEEEVNAEIADMTPQDWKRKTGSEKPIDLEPTNPNSPAEHAASYLTKLKLLHYEPSAKEQSQIINSELEFKDKTAVAERHMQMRQSFEQAMEGTRSMHAKEREESYFNFQRYYKGIDYEAKKQAADKFFNNLTTPAATQPLQHLKGSDGSDVSGYPIQLPSFLENEGEQQIGPHKERPKQWLLSPDKQSFIPIFTATDENTGKQVVDVELSKAKPIETVFKPAFHLSMNSDKPIGQAAPPTPTAGAPKGKSKKYAADDF